MPNKTVQQFKEKLNYSIKKQQFKSLKLSKRVEDLHDLHSIEILAIEDLKNNLPFEIQYKYRKKTEAKQIKTEDVLNLIDKLLGENFLKGDLTTNNEIITIRYNKKSGPKITINKIEENTKKEFNLININNSVYLRSFGIIDQRGEVIKNMHKKYEQIQHFLTIFDQLVSKIELPSITNITEFGCLNSPLSFSLYDYLLNKKSVNPNYKIVENNQNLIKPNINIAQKSGFELLEFIPVEINDHAITIADIVLSLNACDTIADEVIFKAIKEKARIIMVAPCCHEQIKKQMTKESSISSIMKYELLKKRQARIISDGIRALFLELYGYETQIHEFATNHHEKNLIITAIKNDQQPDKEKIKKQIEELKSFYGLDFHYLEELFLFKAI